MDLPDQLLRQAKIAAVERSVTLRELVAEGLERVLMGERMEPRSLRMTKPPVPRDSRHRVPGLTNLEIERILSEEDLAHHEKVFARR